MHRVIRHCKIFVIEGCSSEQIHILRRACEIFHDTIMFTLDLKVGDDMLVVGIHRSRKVSIIICNCVLIHGGVPNADLIQGRIQHHACAPTAWQRTDEESIPCCCILTTSPEDRPRVSWVCNGTCRI